MLIVSIPVTLTQFDLTQTYTHTHTHTGGWNREKPVMVESLPALDACLCGLESNSYCRVLYLNTESQGPHMLDKKLIARGLAGKENKYLFLLQLRNKELNISPDHNMEYFDVKCLTVGSKNQIKVVQSTRIRSDGCDLLVCDSLSFDRIHFCPFLLSVRQV